MCRGWRGTSDALLCHTLPDPLETGSVTEPGVGCLSGSPATSPMSAAAELGLQVTVQLCLAFYMASGDLSSGRTDPLRLLHSPLDSFYSLLLLPQDLSLSSYFYFILVI